MFSEEYYQEIKSGFDGQMALLEERYQTLLNNSKEGLAKNSAVLLGEKIQEIKDALQSCSADEAEALTFLYSAMPVSDMLDYPASTYLTYARHGVFLWEQGPFAGHVPERLFANYVLHYRVNNEDIVDTRGFFYDKTHALVEGKSMYDATVEVNYWLASEGTYHSTDGRTQNARTMYRTATGRCGEESTFGVTVLRSLGIPARQVYAPLWSHCDDNHAWVEAWCDGKWHFLGACEPEKRLDYGWFIGPSSRAMLLHSRWFGKDEPQDPVVGRKGMSRILNHLEGYAHTLRLVIRVVDEESRPVPGAVVTFYVLNHGDFGQVAEIHTDTEGENCGVAAMTTGLGDLKVTATAGDNYGECMVSLIDCKPGDVAEYTITMQAEPECFDGWRDLDFHAPAIGFINDDVLTVEQKKEGAVAADAATAHREKKLEDFYDKREADRVLGRFSKEDQPQVEEILKMSNGNLEELIRFLEWDATGLVPEDWPAGEKEHWKLEVLYSIRPKDYWDVKAEILIDCCMNALPYAGTMPDEVFFQSLLSPKVGMERITFCRTALKNLLSDEEKQEIRKDPAVLTTMLKNLVVAMPAQEYEGLVTSPLGVLRGAIANDNSRDILCINIFRSLGIPARQQMMTRTIECWIDGAFVPVGAEKKDLPSAKITLVGSDTLLLSQWQHFAVSRYENGHYMRMFMFMRQLFMRGRGAGGPGGPGAGRPGMGGPGGMKPVESKPGEELTMEVTPGIYQVVTTNRQTNGNQLVKYTVFSVAEGEEKKITLKLRQIPVEAMLTRHEAANVTFTTLEGEKKNLTELGEGNKAMLLWLEVSKEPTEHILNELYDLKDSFAALTTPLYVVLDDAKEVADKTLQRTMEALPGLKVLVGDTQEDHPVLARSVGQEVGKLPLSMVISGENTCIYSDAGYNVGLGNILLRILA